MDTAAPSLRARALRWLARREHSRRELERKLARHARDTPEASAAAQIAGVLDALAERGLVCDARVAESVLASHGARYGSVRLAHKLQDKGLAAELVAAAVRQSRSTELERALAIWRRRFSGVACDASERARQMRFLAGRGFPAEVVRRVVQAQDDD